MSSQNPCRIVWISPVYAKIPHFVRPICQLRVSLGDVDNPGNVDPDGFADFAYLDFDAAQVAAQNLKEFPNTQTFDQ